jgi:hypothetical protein
MRIFLVVTLISTLFYSMTGLVYFEGSFEGALVVKPYPMYPVLFGGGEQGIWARHHPGQPLPWFMQKDLRVIAPFDWEYGQPSSVTIYIFGALAEILAWVVLAVIGAVRVLRFLVTREESYLSIKVVD